MRVAAVRATARPDTRQRRCQAGFWAAAAAALPLSCSSGRNSSTSLDVRGRQCSLCVLPFCVAGACAQAGSSNGCARVGGVCQNPSTVPFPTEAIFADHGHVGVRTLVTTVCCCVGVFVPCVCVCASVALSRAPLWSCVCVCVCVCMCVCACVCVCVRVCVCSRRGCDWCAWSVAVLLSTVSSVTGVGACLWSWAGQLVHACRVHGATRQ
jgi:hypothetical protein